MPRSDLSGKTTTPRLALKVGRPLSIAGDGLGLDGQEGEGEEEAARPCSCPGRRRSLADAGQYNLPFANFADNGVVTPSSTTTTQGKGGVRKAPAALA